MFNFLAVEQKGFLDQLQIWGVDIWSWFGDTVINPTVNGGIMFIGGVIGSGALLGFVSIYNLLNDD